MLRACDQANAKVNCLHLAAARGQVDVIGLLLDRGMAVDGVDMVCACARMRVCACLCVSVGTACAGQRGRLRFLESWSCTVPLLPCSWVKPH
jgi:hypothetical protein